MEEKKGDEVGKCLGELDKLNQCLKNHIWEDLEIVALLFVHIGDYSTIFKVIY